MEFTKINSPDTATVVGAGRGALIFAMFGSGWLGWGLGGAKAFTPTVGFVFGLIGLFLTACSVYFIREGRSLKNTYPPPKPAPSLAKPVLKPYLLVVLATVSGLVFVSVLANRLQLSNLASDWCCIVIGLHFLPLATIFRAPNLRITGVLIPIWCVISWWAFRGSMISNSASIGTGILLWATCVSALVRAHETARSFRLQTKAP